MTRIPARFFQPAFVLLIFSSIIRAQTFATDGRDACSSNGLDWYTNVVKETPCRTYERLRNLCNPTYKVTPFRSDVLADQCNDQVGSCCCNSISWVLSMLCFNCQAGGQGAGLDAPVGAYQYYLGTCRVAPPRTLPANVQAGVCSKQIDIRSTIYNTFWDTGDWFYVFTSQQFTLDASAHPQANLTNCPATTSSSSTTGSLSTSGSTSALASSTSGSSNEGGDAQASSTNLGAIIGGVVAGVVVLVLVIVFLLWRKRRRARIESPVDLVGEDISPQRAAITVPFMGRAPEMSQSNISLSGHTENAVTSKADRARAPRSVWRADDTTEDAGSDIDAGVIPERHTDAGISLARSESGRLPPAYPSNSQQ